MVWIQVQSCTNKSGIQSCTEAAFVAFRTAIEFAGRSIFTINREFQIKFIQKKKNFYVV